MKKLFLMLAACMAFVAGTAQNTTDTTVAQDTPTATETTTQNRLDINYVLNAAYDYAAAKYGCTAAEVGFFNIIVKNGEKSDNLVLELAVKYKDQLVSDAVMFFIEYGDANQPLPTSVLFLTCDNKDDKENHGVVTAEGTITSSCAECGITKRELKPEKWDAKPIAWPALSDKE